MDAAPSAGSFLKQSVTCDRSLFTFAKPGVIIHFWHCAQVSDQYFKIKFDMVLSWTDLLIDIRCLRHNSKVQFHEKYNNL